MNDVEHRTVRQTSDNKPRARPNKRSRKRKRQTVRRVMPDGPACVGWSSVLRRTVRRVRKREAKPETASREIQIQPNFTK